MDNNKATDEEMYDVEWMALIKIARMRGLTVEETRNILNTLKQPDKGAVQVTETVYKPFRN